MAKPNLAATRRASRELERMVIVGMRILARRSFAGFVRRNPVAHSTRQTIGRGFVDAGGRSRASWTGSLNKPNLKAPPRGLSSYKIPGGHEIDSATSNMKLGDSIFVSNGAVVGQRRKWNHVWHILEPGVRIAKVSGYTRSDGTRVAGYSMKVGSPQAKKGYIRATWEREHRRMKNWRYSARSR